jgi:hypothetical protein
MGTSSGKELKTVAPFPDMVSPPTSPVSYSTEESPGRNPKTINVGPYGFKGGGSMSDLMYDSMGSNNPVTPIGNAAAFNFQMTEGQSRRSQLADCDYECSKITDFLFVGGSKVACSWDALSRNGITRVVNCALTVVDNYFCADSRMAYLSFNLLDSRQDDLTWFVCEVINFIEKGRLAGAKTLLHCEKGVSRSCSFAIAYMMWAQGIFLLIYTLN